MPPQNTSDDLTTAPPSTNAREIELKPLGETKAKQTAERNGQIGNGIEASAKQQSKSATEIKTEDEIIDDTTAAVVVPPDGGWGWVVMVASFLSNTIVDGIVVNSSVYISEANKIEWGEANSISKVSLVSSLLAGFYLLAGPFVSALANRYGFRPVTIAGAIFTAASFAISSQVSSIEVLLVTYGVLGGIGFCLIYIPSVITIGYYFEKWRALATGIALCGSGVGTFVFDPLNKLLLNYVGWRNGLLCQAGIILCCAALGATYRPIQPLQVPLNDDEDDKKDNKITSNGHDVLKQQTNFLSKPLPEGRFAYSMPNSAHNTYMGAAQKYHYPTAAEVFRGSTANLERRLSNVSAGNPMPIQQHIVKIIEQKHPIGLNKELSTVGENEEDVTESQTLLQQQQQQNPDQQPQQYQAKHIELKPIIISPRRHTVSGRRPNDMGNFKSSTSLKHDSEIRPMYRDDVFFTGSLVRLPQYTSQTSLGYHMSVTRLPTKQDLIEQKQKRFKLCSEAIKRTLSTMLDVSLLKSPSFMLLSMSGFLTMMGFYVPFAFSIKRAEMMNIPHLNTTIIPVIGATNTIARITCGLLSSFQGINALHLNNIAITAGGIATIASSYMLNSAGQYIFGALFGICIACFSALRSIIAVEMIGLEKLTNAFGFLMLFQGVAATIGSPIAGSMVDEGGKDFTKVFWFAGILITLSAILCYPLNYVSRWEREREEKKNKNSTNGQA